MSLSFERDLVSCAADGAPRCGYSPGPPAGAEDPRSIVAGVHCSPLNELRLLAAIHGCGLFRIQVRR